MHFSQKYLISLAVLIALSLAVYGHTLNYPFVFDDETSVENNPTIQSLSNIPALFLKPGTKEADSHETGAYRPAVFASYALDYAGAGLSPGQFRLTNIALHILNAFLLFLIIQALLAPRGPDPWPWSLLAAALFMVHPVQTESVIYVSARSVLLLTAFFLASLLCYIRYRAGGKAGMLVAAVALFSLALLTKESAVPLAGVFIMLELHLSRVSRTASKGFSWRTTAPFLVAAVCYLAVRLYALSQASNPFTPGGYVTHWMTEASVLPRYFKLLIFPRSLSVDHYVPDVTSLFDWRFLAGLAIIALTVYIFSRWYKKDRLMAAMLAWPLIALLPEMLVPLPDKMVEYRLYLPLAGILILKAAALQGGMARPLNKKAVYVTAMLACLIFVFGAASFDRGKVWAGPETLWRDAVRKEPLLARPYMNLGVYYFKQKDYSRSLKLLKEAVRLEPGFDEAYANLGNTYIVMGQPREAAEMYRKAFELNPRNMQAGNNLGVTYMILGEYEEAYRTYAELAGAFPEDLELLQSVAELFEYYGRQEFAERFDRLYEERLAGKGPGR